MTFEDTSVGDLVKITIHNDNKKLGLESKIIHIVDNCLVVEPFVVNNTMLSFPKNMEIELIVVHNEQTPYYWQRVQVLNKIYHEQNCHVITSNLPGIKYNRRSNFRVPINATVKMIGLGDSPISVILKDISNSGFALLLDKDTKLDLHKQVTIEYLDREHQKYFELSGRAIRKVEIEHYMLFGFILDRRYPDLENYLAQKQMENRPNRRRD